MSPAFNQVYDLVKDWYYMEKEFVMIKFNKIFCALALLSSFALLSGTVFAEPEGESDGV